jgi:hypothetical protein
MSRDERREWRHKGQREQEQKDDEDRVSDGVAARAAKDTEDEEEEIDEEDADELAKMAVDEGEDDGIGRHILTARKGQSPRHWIDFEEVYEMVSTKPIHCIFALRSTVAKQGELAAQAALEHELSNISLQPLALDPKSAELLQ